MHYSNLIAATSGATAISATILAFPVNAQESQNTVQLLPAIPENAEVYAAQLRPINPTVTDRNVFGNALFVVNGTEMTVYVDAVGLAPGQNHLQHYHGFTNGQDATCPPANADTNGDGIVDITETEPYTGQTLVPFHDQPASLEGLLSPERFPIATAPYGLIDYQQTVPVGELESALQREYSIPSLNLEQRTVFLHGIESDASLPDTVQSIANVPAQTTLPIACGEIVRVD